MGVRTTVLGTTLTDTNINTAAAAGRSASMMNSVFADQLQDCITNIKEMLKDMEDGDNKTAYQGFLTTLG